MKASELVKVLQRLIAEKGDQPVYAGGTDYPERVGGVEAVKRGDGYTPTGAFRVW